MSEKIKKRKRIRINHSKSPFNRIKKKSFEKEFKNEDLEEKIQNLEQVISRTQRIIDEFERDEKRDHLLQMMYQDDVDEDFVRTSMNISENELNLLVEELISRGFLQFVSGDEVELTKDGILYMKNQDLE
jgi:superfamily II RNA helicase